MLKGKPGQPLHHGNQPPSATDMVAYHGVQPQTQLPSQQMHSFHIHSQVDVLFARASGVLGGTRALRDHLANDAV